MADTNTAFVWGPGGAELTPGQLSARRQLAQAMMTQGMDYSPIKSAWQGAARVAQSVAGAYDSRRADQDEAAARQQSIADILKAYPQLGTAFGGGQALPPAAAAPGAAVPGAAVPAAPGAAPAASIGPVSSADTSDKIYTNDQPSPLDPPSGTDRDMAIRTIIAEAGNQPFAGQTGVASVIRNRAVDGSYGGDTVPGVIQKPYAFEPWNTQAGRDRMAAVPASDPRYVTAGKALDSAYFGEDPTEGATHFVAPKAQAALGRPMPAWAKGESTTIGDHVFYSPDDAAPARPVQVASALPFAPPTGAAAGPSPGVAAVTQAMPANAPLPAAPAAPAAPEAGVAPAPGAPAQPRPDVAAIMKAMSSPFLPPALAQLAAAQLQKTMTPQHRQETDKDGNIWEVDPSNNERKVLLKANEDPTSVREFEYGQKHPDFATAQLARTKAGATSLNNIGNVDQSSGQTYDKQLAEGLGKAHAGLANGVEDAQGRARDLAAMQGAIDAIQKGGGTTGGLGQTQKLELQKTVNAGLAALGVDKVFNENDISDKEFLTKFNRTLAGQAAKSAVGSRVTNFEMSNYLKANPGLDMSVTGNQRLIGIQSQIEQRNIAVGNAIRDATASAISAGKKIDPVTVQKIITDYDTAHHVQDPVTGQDLTQSYALPEFQQGANAPLAVGHEANIDGIKIKRLN